MKNSGGNWVFALLLIIICIFSCGVLAAGDFSHIGKVQPSQEIVDQNAAATTAAQIARENKINQVIADFLDALTKLIFLTVASLVVAGIITLAAFAVSKWIKRHDRQPDEAGRYPLVPSNATLTNPNLTGALTAAPARESVQLQLAGMRAQVDMTAMAFRAGIQGRQASDRQRDLRPDPPGWDGSIEMPPSTVNQPGFWLTSDDNTPQMALANTTPKTTTMEERVTW